jgi:hypothetical protein
LNADASTGSAQVTLIEKMNADKNDLIDENNL